MREIPKPRQIEIFRQLMMAGVPLDIATLKEKLQKSERTIRYDMQDLKRICQEYGIEIGYLTKKGYFIPAAQKPDCSALLVQWDSGSKGSFVDGDEEQRFASLFFYLFSQKGYVTAEKLAEVYLASKSTLTRGLGRLEEYFGGSFRLDIRKAQGLPPGGRRAYAQKTGGKASDQALRGGQPGLQSTGASEAFRGSSRLWRLYRGLPGTG